jgi:hypothetical protein
MRLPLLAALLLATPAAAQSDLSLSQVGAAYCAAVTANDWTAIAPLLTPELAELAADTGPAFPGDAPAPASCRVVGASGTYDHPESVLFLGFPDGSTISDRLVMSFIDAQLRIDDVSYGNGGSLRQTLSD